MARRVVPFTLFKNGSPVQSQHPALPTIRTPARRGPR
jgi:hypothetical protein